MDFNKKEFDKLMFKMLEKGNDYEVRLTCVEGMAKMILNVRTS